MGAATVISAFPFFFLLWKFIIKTKRRVVGVNLAPSKRSAKARAHSGVVCAESQRRCPFVERSLVTEDTRHSQLGHKDTTEKNWIFKRLHSSPLHCRCVLTVGVWEDLCCLGEKWRRGIRAVNELEGGDLKDSVTAPDGVTISPKSLISHTFPACVGWNSHFYASFYARVLPARDETMWSWSFWPRFLSWVAQNSVFCFKGSTLVPKECQLINTQTWRKNCGYSRIWIWCTSVRLRSAYR